MSIQRLIRREVGAQAETFVGTVVSELRLIDFDGSGGGVWVCDVEAGGNNVLRDVPVKAQVNRFYAQLGQTVTIKRTAKGRIEIIGPGERLSGELETIAYNLETQVGGTPVDSGFSFERVPFSFYATLDAAAPLGVLWADGVTPFNLVRIVDAAGNPV